MLCSHRHRHRHIHVIHAKGSVFLVVVECHGGTLSVLGKSFKYLLEYVFNITYNKIN